jgi:hypothetical protein
MRRRNVLMLVVLVLGAALLPGTLATAKPSSSSVFRSSLSPAEEVSDPLVVSSARGNALLRLSKDGTELHYKVTVSRIEDVTQAHLHLAPAGRNGPVVAWLYPSAPPAQLIAGRLNGVLVSGTLTAANLTGALAGGDMGDLVELIRDGDVYVNVHTASYPAGEIRGQL